jgi:hypothetical protein
MGYLYGIESYSGLTTATNNFELGYVFTANEDMIICGLRVMYPAVQTTTAHLWDSSGNLIAYADITAEAGAWVESMFDTPVQLESGKTYTVSCYNTSTRYQGDRSNFTFSSKITYIAGVYNSTRNSFPSSRESNRMYPLVDIIIQNYDSRFLIRVGNEVFTKVDGTLTSLGEVELTADLFLNNGFEEKPTNDDLINLEHPEVLLWNNSDDVIPQITANVIASPKESQQIITNAIYLTDSTIKGIENVTADCDGDLIIAVSFDNKQTWKAWNGSSWSDLSQPFSGMSKETLEGITIDQWKILLTDSTKMYLRLSFVSTTQVLRQIYIDFLN